MVAGSEGPKSVHRTAVAIVILGLMEASELTAWITALTQAPSRAAGGGGGAAEAEASHLVRERLGSTPEGRAALDPERGDPGEAARQVVAALDTDPAFARRLEQLYELARQRPPGAPVAGRDLYQASIGDRSRHNTIAFGPLTVRKEQVTPTTVTAMLLVVALVLGLAVYGLVQAVDGGDDGSEARGNGSAGVSGGSDGDGSELPLSGEEVVGEDARKAAPVRDFALAEAILPDLPSMPSGWSAEEEAQTQEVTADNCSPGDCGGLLSEGEVTYAASGTSDLAYIQVEAYDGVGTASAGYQERVESMGSDEDVSSMSLEEIGDESSAFSRQEYTGSAYTYAVATVVRAGTVVIRVTYGGGYDELNSDVLSGIARMVTERAWEAQSGDEPSAAFAEAP